MDKVKICLTTQKYEDTSLEIESMVEKDNVLTIMLKHYYADIKVGDILSFIRCALYEGDTTPTLVQRYDTNVLSLDIEVISETLKKTVLTIAAPNDYRIKISEVTESEGTYKLDLSDTHYIFAQDIMSLNQDLKFYYLDINTGVSGETFGISDISFHDYDKVIGYNIEPKYCLFNIKPIDTHNECESGETVYEMTPNYYYVDGSIDRKILYIKNLLTDSTNLFKRVYAPYNLFYYKDEEGNCYLWEDFDKYYEIGQSITEIDGISTEYSSSDKEYEYSFADFVKNNNALKVAFGFTQNTDYKHLYQEELVTKIFSDKVKESVVSSAPIIDMEKVKFAPYYLLNGEEVPASALTFNLHFRCREDLEESWRYIKPDTPVWNTIDNYSDITINNEEVGKSDMLYYLGFTDNDVQNQKAKIKKSFLRLSFYDSADPLTQKLLYYSTIFMDSGELFGKYVKAKEELRKEYKSTDNVVLDSQSSKKNRLDCRFVVRDEYYTEKCSEGFNIYYFPSDVILSENSEKTIYMKVEFNHAGFGRTMPFIACKFGKSNLSLEDYKKGLYIKLKLKYIDGKYMYLVDEDNDKTIKIENATITFNLFEPKLMK